MFASAASYLSAYLSGDKAEEGKDTIPTTVHNSSSSLLNIDTAKANREYTIQSLAGLSPNDPLARDIVYIVMGIENASPTMIQDIMRGYGLPFSRSCAPSPQPFDPPSVTILEHIPGVNDLASGALPANARITRPGTVVVPISPEDRVFCHDDVNSLLIYQQDSLFTKESVALMLDPASRISPEAINNLPDLYHTTLRGLQRAVREIQTGDGMDEAAAQLEALMRRGGEPVGGRLTRVVYAEELVPYVKDGEVGYDAEFWESIEVLKRENEETGIADLVAWAADR